MSARGTGGYSDKNPMWLYEAASQNGVGDGEREVFRWMNADREHS